MKMTASPQHSGPGLSASEAAVARGASIYTPWTLALYDVVVLGLSNALVWRFSTRHILNLYNENVSGRHLDVGVGTGYFLDRCRFPIGAPTIALLDLNPNSLAATAKRLRRYAPSCHQGNVLDPVDFGMCRFDSIGLNYLLHCLPGNLRTKSTVFHHLKLLLSDKGVLFGSTILGKDVQRSLPARSLMNLYNAKGVFSNLSDCKQDLEAGLDSHFDEYAVRVQGCVALFSARKPKLDLRV